MEFGTSLGYAGTPLSRKSRLVCAMKLETMVHDESGLIVHIAGLHISEQDSDIPNDALFSPLG
jgi:hypothetical protein